jgi:hypothetical protein
MKVAEVEEMADMTEMEVMEVPEEDIKVLIVYSPMYGHISRMAEDVKEGERA